MATTPKKTAAPKPAAKKPVAKKAAAKKPAAKPVNKKPAPKGGKPAAPKKAAEAKKPVAAPTQKVVRDGFTMPQADYDKLKELKALCLKNGVEVKKSTLLRAGLHALQALPTADLLARLRGLPPIKAGRKKK